MINQRIGKFVNCAINSPEPYKAYIPPKLPPQPIIDITQFFGLLDRANVALGRLDGVSLILPDPQLFLYMYVRKEAVLSSQIEGTQSSLSDLFMFENEIAKEIEFDDVSEVSSYVEAMDYGLERLKEIPISLRLIKEIHAKLMKNSRGSNKNPGEFRNSQNWIGGTRPGNAIFVPPPPTELIEYLGDLEKFIHDEEKQLPTLIKAAIAHLQFETIHPFLDGNGRLGRLLITFILCSEGVLQSPMLYLSLYLKKHRQTYYDLLQSVRMNGNWEDWIEFFLKGVVETAQMATQTAKRIVDLFTKDNKLITMSGDAKKNSLAIHSVLQRNPVINTKRAIKSTKASLPTVLRSLESLVKLGIVKEVTGRDRNKIFVYEEYLAILNDGA